MIATHSWLNVLLVFVPVGIAVDSVPGIHKAVVFTINCIAVVPLAGLLGYATESVALKMGDAPGALINVTFGNAVELIIFIIALTKDQIRIVQASLLGSILANLLLILGMGFFLGGLRYREQVYNSTVTQMSACLLSLSVASLMLPTAFHASFDSEHRADIQSAKISRGTSVILLLVYGVYLVFQLKSHAYLYKSMPQHIVDAESSPGPAAAWLDSSSSDEGSDAGSNSAPIPLVRHGIRRTRSLPDRLEQTRRQRLRRPGCLIPSRVSRLWLAAKGSGSDAEAARHEEGGDEHLSRTASVILLLATTGLVAVCAELMIGTIEAVTSTGVVGEAFIGLIIIPVVGNAAEHVTAVTVAIKNKMDLAIGVAVGSSIQIALLITPLVVILGWIMGKEMTLYFTLFETVCLFVSTLIVNFLVLDGRSNYLEGALLCAVYLIISVVAFFYPDANEATLWGV